MSLSKIKFDKKIVLSYVNVHAINLAFKNSRFKKFINKSNISFCDGYGIRYAAGILGLLKPVRMTPPDWIDDLAKFCYKNNFSLYFIGGRSEISKNTAEKLKLKYPQLNILDTTHGYHNKLKNSKENKIVVEKINKLKPDILIIGFVLLVIFVSMNVD